MNIIVLNGSPKGQTSVTMQYVHYLQKQLPQHTWEIVDIAQRLCSLERDQAAFDRVIAQVRAADGVLWAFPLYVCLVHGNYKRFIELIWERGATDAFRGKHTASLSTSIHFFDHTAHAYIRAICDDLDMRYVGAFAADMNDLFDAAMRDQLARFGERLVAAIAADAPAAKIYRPVARREFAYRPAAPAEAVPLGGKRVTILTDAAPHQANLLGMIERLRASWAGEVEVVNLREVDIAGGCLGCLRCAYDNTCAYAGKDGFTPFYEAKLKGADIIVYAATVVDRYFSSLWKTFFDRSFYNTHTPTLMGKQFALLISGPWSQMDTLREIMQTYAEWQRMNLAGVVTDEYAEPAEMDALLQSLAANLARDAQTGYVAPRTFLGVGGMRIFRDEIWGRLRAMFRADHLAYKRMGVYDFPQRDWRVRLQNAVLAPLLGVRKVREMFNSRMKEGMVQPYQKLLR